MTIHDQTHQTKLEFVNYDDPEYVVDQGDEFYSNPSSPDDTEEKIEEMREDRRRRNDEFQFETYHASILKSGESFKGEWTVYRTSTFLEGQEGEVDVNGLPRLVKAKKVMKVVSSGSKIQVPMPTSSDTTVPVMRVDGERIVHVERLAVADDFRDDESKGVKGEEQSTQEKNGANGSGELDAMMKEHAQMELDIIGKQYWPDQMGSRDFRGQAGIMCVGNAYTICHAVPLVAADQQDYTNEKFDGPFEELRTELGIQYKRMRFRVKLDYKTKDSEQINKDSYPALDLKTITVCRETLERWPRYDNKLNVDDAVSANLFGPAGASGGLYDPPPVGSEKQAKQYMMLDLEGGATLLFPHKINQDPGAHGGNGWVTSLDWTPGRLRYQVDRKVLGGLKVRGLRTLELSEVEGADADRWRPKDGGEDMRQ